MRNITLADGTPALVEWERKCPQCGQWLGVNREGLARAVHGSLGRPWCKGEGTGRKRLSVDVQQRRTDDRDGNPRWSSYNYVRPTPAQRAEARRIFTGGKP